MPVSQTPHREMERCLGNMHVTIGFKALSLKGMKVSSFEGLGVQTELEYMYLQHNVLSNFQFLGCQPNLREINVQHNHIATLAGLVKQPKVEEVFIRNNPIARHQHHRLMLLLCLGSSLRKVDGAPITFAERDVVRRLPEAAAYAVSCGWLLDLQRRTYSEYLILADEAKTQLNLAAGQPPIGPPPPPHGAQLPDVHQTLAGGLHPSHYSTGPAVHTRYAGGPPERVSVPASSPPRRQASPHTARHADHSPSIPPYHDTLSEGGVDLSPARRSAAGGWSAPGSAAPQRRGPHMSVWGGQAEMLGALAPPAGSLSPRAQEIRSSQQGQIQQLRAALEEARSGLMKEKARSQRLLLDLQDALATHPSKAKRVRRAGDMRDPAAEADDDAVTTASHTTAAAPPFMDAKHLSYSELAEVADMTFGGGIKVNSTLKSLTSVPSAHVVLDASYISVAHFFNRTRLGEVPLSHITEVKLDQAGKVLFLRIRDENMLEMLFDSEQKLVVMYKVLHFRLGWIPEYLAPAPSATPPQPPAAAPPPSAGTGGTTLTLKTADASRSAPRRGAAKSWGGGSGAVKYQPPTPPPEPEQASDKDDGPGGDGYVAAGLVADDPSREEEAAPAPTDPHADAATAPEDEPPVVPNTPSVYADEAASPPEHEPEAQAPARAAPPPPAADPILLEEVASPGLATELDAAATPAPGTETAAAGAGSDSESEDSDAEWERKAAEMKAKLAMMGDL
eukprot:TRINITY_DN7803_c0_g1_i1.p1 TRINITY_DN7803_c0_g1~~TRINITY_DN7803_c0_g1_i1.p1  ORF type:complete len:766 (+),score=266.52 TRINITY_DN7803_c0_g1_i1:100-2298(+)